MRTIQATATTFEWGSAAAGAGALHTGTPQPMTSDRGFLTANHKPYTRPKLHPHRRRCRKYVCRDCYNTTATRSAVWLTHTRTRLQPAALPQLYAYSPMHPAPSLHGDVCADPHAQHSFYALHTFPTACTSPLAPRQPPHMQCHKHTQHQHALLHVAHATRCVM
jgi:hypothetical protein